MASKKTAFFVESIPLVEEKPSGVAHSLAGLVSALAADRAFTDKYEIVLVAPKRALHNLDRWPGLQNCRRKGMPLRMKVINGLIKFHLLPAMDLLLGRGVYLFGNFKNWPVTKRSLSLTYVHDICYALYPQFVSPKNQQFLIKNVPKFMKRSDYVVTVSESSRQEIIDYYHLDPSRVAMLYNGVDRSLFRTYKSSEVDEVKAKYDIQGKYYLFVSSIEPRKNLLSLVKAFQQLPKERSLVIVGGMGWLNETTLAEIESARARGFSIIKPQTFVPDEDVALLMSGADALVHPAFHEGFGMTPAEAMAAEIPVVVADIPSLREVVGDAGIYCDPNDESSIAEAMKKVVKLSDQERQKLIEQGIIQVKQFTWEKSATKLREILDK